MDPAIVVALVGGSVSLTAAVMGYRRSKVVDATSAQSGVASNHRAGIDQAFKALNDVVDQLQEENARLREEAERRRAEADQRSIRLEAMTLEVARLRRKYGNGDDTPNPPNK